MATQEDVATIINGISVLILRYMNSCASEQWAPGSDPDKMDETIKYNYEKAQKLRKLREDFENIVTDIVPINR